MSKELQYLRRELPDLYQESSNFMFGGYDRKVTPTSIHNYISRVQFERIAHDIGMWRDVIKEMELTFHPSRVAAMRMYIDVVENPYLKAVIERWQDLTIQRDITIFQVKGGKKIVSQDLTQQMESQYWIRDYIEHVLDAILWGYSLIGLGDLISDQFPYIQAIPRENVVPDGGGRGKPTLTSMTYGVDGLHVTENKLIDLCNHWIPTKPQRHSSCGYGLLYNLSLPEIHLRHITEWNVDFAEGYGMPIKKGSTNKTGKDRAKFERFLASGASNQWILLDKAMGDDVVYEMAANAGTAWKTYDNLEERLQGIIAQLLLGHTDGMKSTPGKLGGMQAANKDGFNESLIEQAMNSKQIRCGDFVSRKMNEIFAPKMRELGELVGSNTLKNLIPVGYKFGLQNDKEEQSIKKRINAERTVVAGYVKTLNDAGWNVDGNYISEWMGMKVTEGIPATMRIEERTSITKTAEDEPKKIDS